MYEPNICNIKKFAYKIDDSFSAELFKRRLRSFKACEVELRITANFTNGILQFSDDSFRNAFNCDGLLVCFNTLADFNTNNDAKFAESHRSTFAHLSEISFDEDDLNYYINKLNKFVIFTYVDLTQLIFHYRIIVLSNFYYLSLVFKSDDQYAGLDNFFGIEKIFLLQNNEIKNLNALKTASKQDGTLKLIIFSDNESINPISLHIANILSYLFSKYELTELKIYIGNEKCGNFAKLSINHSEKLKIADDCIISGTKSLDNSSKFDMSDLTSNLHFELAMWRIIPELDQSKIGNLSITILGMGTLGCSIATQLISWGIRNVTLVDSGRVNHFNIIRQSLYCLDDAKNRKLKVDAAKEYLLKIAPNLNIKKYNLDIPMLGHSIYLNDLNKLQDSVNQLNEIINTSDVVFMVTDTRESRWLPTLMIAHRNWKAQSGSPDSKGCLGIVASIGFDSCLVSRQAYGKFKGCCYFCGDFTAPNNSKITGFNDEICTVTRPGIAAICACLSVELLASITQSKFNFAAEHSEVVNTSSCLGATPQTIRFNLANYSLSNYCNEANPKCICCSLAVLEAYDEARIDLLKQVISRPYLLVALTQLNKLDMDDDVIAL